MTRSLVAGAVDGRWIVVSVLLLVVGCGSALQGEESTSPEESLTSEALPIPEYDEESAAEEPAAEEPATEEPAAEEPAAEEPASSDAGILEPGDAAADGAADADSEEPQCVLDVTQAAVVRQVARFRRWLRDQSVGRHVLIDAVTPRCGDRGGFLTAELVLSGPAGGLQSLSRALTSYYPGSAWTVTEHHRLEGSGVPLRVNVEVRVPTGADPVPRCQWDPELSCEGAEE